MLYFLLLNLLVHTLRNKYYSKSFQIQTNETKCLMGWIKVLKACMKKSVTHTWALWWVLIILFTPSCKWLIRRYLRRYLVEFLPSKTFIPFWLYRRVKSRCSINSLWIQLTSLVKILVFAIFLYLCEKSVVIGFAITTRLLVDQFWKLQIYNCTQTIRQLAQMGWVAKVVSWIFKPFYKYCAEEVYSHGLYILKLWINTCTK